MDLLVGIFDYFPGLLRSKIVAVLLLVAGIAVVAASTMIDGLLVPGVGLILAGLVVTMFALTESPRRD
ncbi:hypothetical protein BRD17_04050 [Halobacteriales archaeon SW_7_68_16]|nr:MAG: hypothetical protein BRD17_04050 [Halobacteriales archaeon SW_7_68_16]